MLVWFLVKFISYVCLFVVCLSVCLLFFVLICLFICLNVTLIIICHEFDTQIRVDLVIRHHKIGICPLFLIASFLTVQC